MKMIYVVIQLSRKNWYLFVKKNSGAYLLFDWLINLLDTVT